jgi:carboxypeptidase PM20D1
MAHQDVVPAPTEDWAAAGWSHPPFAGVVEDGEEGLTVYGRGALDDKGALLVLLEAVEDLLAEGWQPHDDLYLSLGGDEESDGPSAVAAIAELERRGVRPVLVVDEGGAVTSGLLPGLTRQVAVVGVAEKGVVNLEVSVSADPRKPAHGSTPPRRSTTAALGRALAALERHPHPAVLDDIAVRMFTELAPYIPGPLQLLLSRADQLRPVLAQAFPFLGPEMAAMVRTTTAATMLTGSSAPNVLASKATAIVNMRVATSSTLADAVRHVEVVVRRAVGSALTVEVRVLEGHEPTPASPFDKRWEAVRAAVAESYPDALTVPYTMLGASDARHAARIAPAVYRFSPLYMSSAQRASVHGVDERVTADSLVRGVRFYRALITGSRLTGPVAP